MHVPPSIGAGMPPSVSAKESDKQVVVVFTTPYTAFQLQKNTITQRSFDCLSVDGIPFGGQRVVHSTAVVVVVNDVRILDMCSLPSIIVYSPNEEKCRRRH